MASQCNNQTLQWSTFAINTYYTVYYGVFPTYLTFGFIANVFLLITFCKQTRKEGAYAYQAVLSIAKLYEFVSFGTLTFWYRLGLGSASPPGSERIHWIVNSYWLMLIYANIVTILGFSSLVISLLCTVAMATDRVFALHKPFIYKNINHRRHQIVAGLTCFGLGLLVSIEDYWMAIVTDVGDHYAPFPNPLYFTNPILNTLSLIRTIIRFSSLVILILLNSLMIYLYKKRAKVGQLTTAQRAVEKKKEVERTLVRLSICQSILMCINEMPHLIVWTLYGLGIDWVFCNEKVIFPFVDAAVFASDIINTFVLATVDKKIRKFANKVVPIFRCKCANSTSSLIFQPSPRRQS